MVARILSLLLTVLLLAACGSVPRSSECDDLPPDEKEQCMAELLDAMDEYKRMQEKDTVQNPRY